MARAKRHSKEIKNTDGRKGNGGNSTKPKKIDEPRSVPAKRNKAKQDRTHKYIKKALTEVLGKEGADGEYEFWKVVVEKSKDSFPDRNLIANKLEQSKPSGNSGSQAPIINFFTNNTNPPSQESIDVDHEEID